MKTRPSGRPSKITLPARCHPLAMLVFLLMQRQAVSYDELEHKAGVLRATVKSWRTGVVPSLTCIAAALGALVWELRAGPDSGEELDGDARQSVEEAADLWRRADPTLAGVLAQTVPTFHMPPTGDRPEDRWAHPPPNRP